ncbi:hypothetical protein D3C84_901730 [compost metagenome]
MHLLRELLAGTRREYGDVDDERRPHARQHHQESVQRDRKSCIVRFHNRDDGNKRQSYCALHLQLNAKQDDKDADKPDRNRRMAEQPNGSKRHCGAKYVRLELIADLLP